MKVLLELLEDTTNVLSNLGAVDELRPSSQEKLVDLLESLSVETDRLLEEVESVEAAAEESGDTREQILERGLAAIARDQLDEAKTLLREGVEEFPEDVELLNHLGLTCWESGEIEEAEQWYGRAMQAGLSEVRPRQGNLCAAPPSGYLRALEGRALSLYRLGAYDRAVSLFDALANLAPGEYGGCHYLAGEIRHLQGRPHEAIESYRRSPDEPSVHYNLGLACYQVGRREDAARTLIRGFSANPHIAVRLLDEEATEVAGPGGYLGSATYAEEFLEACTPLWTGCEKALEFVHRCFEHPLVQEYLEAAGPPNSGDESGGVAGRGRSDSSRGGPDVDGIARQVIEPME